jgi:hypothetical protein
LVDTRVVIADLGRHLGKGEIDGATAAPLEDEEDHS